MKLNDTNVTDPSEIRSRHNDDYHRLSLSHDASYNIYHLKIAPGRRKEERKELAHQMILI